MRVSHTRNGYSYHPQHTMCCYDPSLRFVRFEKMLKHKETLTFKLNASLENAESNIQEYVKVCFIHEMIFMLSVCTTFKVVLTRNGDDMSNYHNPLKQSKFMFVTPQIRPH